MDGSKSVYNASMNTRVSGILLLVLTLVLGGYTRWTARAQNNDIRYFPETGHTLQGAFREFYESTPDALLLFGYPITEAFTDSGGLEVQYFQKARFERNPAALSSPVRLTPLGALLYAQSSQHTPVNIPANATACRSFPETGHSLCYDFLAYWEAHNGEQYLGRPISPLEKEGDRIVQYLEYGRLEWHPENVGGAQIVLANLGEVYFQVSGENPQLLKAIGGAFIARQSITAIQAHAFVTRASVSQQDEQHIYIIVRDQNKQPIEGATAAVTLLYPDGSSARYAARQNTNRFGFTVVDVAVNARTTGIVEVRVDITAPNGLEESTRTSFRIWY